MRIMLSVLVTGAGLLLGGVSTWAHHSFASEFDQSKPIKLEGTVTQMEWINPHSWIHIDVEESDGTTASWMIEAGSPNIMARRGFTKDSLLPGTEVIVEGYLARDGKNRANGNSITYTDGRRLFLGGSSPDQP